MEQATVLFKEKVIPAILLHTKSPDIQYLSEKFLEYCNYRLYFNHEEDYEYVTEVYDEFNVFNKKFIKRVAACVGYPPQAIQDLIEIQDAEDKIPVCYVNYHGIRFECKVGNEFECLRMISWLYEIPDHLKTKVSVKYAKVKKG